MAKLLLTALKLVQASGDNRLYVKAATADNVYVTGGVTLDISPGKITDPNALALLAPRRFLALHSRRRACIAGRLHRAGGADDRWSIGVQTAVLDKRGERGPAVVGYSAAISAGNLILEIPYES